MVSHPQKFKILGFCDLAQKPRGMFCLVMFDPKDVYIAKHLPKQSDLKNYAEHRGYTPGRPKTRIFAGLGMANTVEGKCEPIYEIVGDNVDGFDYLNCRECCLPHQVTDNLKTS